MRNELMLDNLGMCRFHRAWAEEMLPEIVETLFGMKDQFLENCHHGQPDQQQEFLDFLGIGTERGSAYIPQTEAGG